MGEAGGAEKDRFTSLDALALAREVRALGRAHVDKAYDAGPEAYAITLRAPGAGRRELLVVLGRYAALLDRGAEHPEEPGALARDLRRLLSGAVVTGVPDPGGERQVELELSRADGPEPLRLIVELFGTGNLVVVRGSKIVAVAHPKVWAHRALRIGAEFHPPPSRGDPWTRTVAEIEATLGASRTDRASTLAARLGFGGPLAEEILARAGIAGALPSTEDAHAVAATFHRAISELLAEVGERPRGYLCSRGGVPHDVSPFRSVRWTGSDLTVETTEHFSEAAQRFFSSLGPTSPVPPSPLDEARAELVRLRERQSTAVAGLLEEATRLTAAADAIYAHYAEASRIREEAERDAVSAERIEATLGEVRVPLWVGRPLEASARTLYEEAKRAQAKLAGAQEALADTERRLVLATAAATPRTPEAAATTEPRRRLWFEAYRWFLSSEGVVVIGGRDAASNDLIVRRYLKSRDLYVHADIHGAPSVIVKHPGEGSGTIGPPTLTEAAQFGVAFSKAWRAGLASASAFWVTAEQVSKSAGSGEFVARGAWVIHGTKNVLRDLPVELGIGTVEVQGGERWCVAPESALRSRGRLRLRLAPGEERDRPTVEVELSRELGLPRSRLQSMLPAGGIRVLRA